MEALPGNKYGTRANRSQTATRAFSVTGLIFGYITLLCAYFVMDTVAFSSLEFR
jgi:hypothetical protein